ncbi:MAG: ABC transporter permease [bacterium]
MSRIISEIRASFAFVERNFNLVRRYAGWEAVFLVYTVVNTLTIAFIAAGDPQKILYLVVGSLLWGFLSVIFHDVSESVAWERWEGTIEYTFMSPILRITHLFGQCSFSILYGILRTVIVLVAVALFFRINLSNANFLSAVVMLVVASFSFMGLGLMVAVLPLISPEKGPQATHIFQAVILLISGVYYEVSVLPPWIRPLSYISPGTYTLRSIRGALLENKSLVELAPDLIILVAIGVILIPLGLWVFHMGEVYAKRHGKLKRSG